MPISLGNFMLSVPQYGSTKGHDAPHLVLTCVSELTDCSGAEPSDLEESKQLEE